MGGKPIDHKIRALKDIPATTKESDALSKDLLKRGFKFVGSAICYAFMQAVGMVNDHETRCFRHSELSNFSAHLRGTGVTRGREVTGSRKTANALLGLPPVGLAVAAYNLIRSPKLLNGRPMP